MRSASWAAVWIGVPAPPPPWDRPSGQRRPAGRDGVEWSWSGSAAPFSPRPRAEDPVTILEGQPPMLDEVGVYRDRDFGISGPPSGHVSDGGLRGRSHHLPMESGIWSAKEEVDLSWLVEEQLEQDRSCWISGDGPLLSLAPLASSPGRSQPAGTGGGQSGCP